MRLWLRLGRSCVGASAFSRPCGAVPGESDVGLGTKAGGAWLARTCTGKVGLPSAQLMRQ
jgi:hypothetical protein